MFAMDVWRTWRPCLSSVGRLSPALTKAAEHGHYPHDGAFSDPADMRSADDGRARQPVDIIDLFRAPQYCPAHAQEVLALPWKPLCFWMQEGIRSAEARALLEPEQILVVEDLCLMVEHARLLTLQK